MSSQPRITLLVLYCQDLHANREFYAGLGLRLEPEQHGDGPRHWAAELPDGTVFELYPASERRPPSSLRLGLAVTAGRTDPPLDLGRHLLRDPDGRTVEVHAG
ncbi:hypothetical protein AB0M36_34870 [Actinoplanes sp. NPDC051346]|uniref:VOC family protein n=1 Tax=Actinoplanes sp. NPDC051346 TaxID=3155048 RepID=UPI003414D7EA